MLLQTDNGAVTTGPYLIVDEPMVEDAVHVSAEPFQATILGPHIRIASGHQTFHCGLQVAQQLPMFLPTEEHSKLYQTCSKRSYTTTL